MTSRTRLVLVATLLLPLSAFLGATRARGDGAGTKQQDTLVVTRRPFVVTLQTSGTFSPNEPHAVSYHPEEYAGPLEIVEAADAGPVVAGQTLVRFDEEPIAKQIRDRERDLAIARTRLQDQEQDAQAKKAAAALQKRQLEQRLQRAQSDLDRFRSHDKATRIAQSEFNLQGAENRLQDQREELEQLVKMYQADDLTEETEAIVIRRARRSLARAEKSLVWQRERHQDLVDITLPREEEDKVADLEKRRQDVQNFEATVDADQRRIDLELDKARDAYADQEKRLRDLRADREHFRLRAPVDGYAVPGAFAGGWKDLDGAARQLERGRKVKPNDVLFTVVRPGDVGVDTQVGEADLLRVRPGQVVEVRPGVLPDRTLTGQVESVMAAGSGGKYAVHVALKESDEHLMPGQSCKLGIRIRRTEDALVIPAKAVGTAGGTSRVWVVEEGKVTPRKVKLGESSEGRVEVLDGLKEGDRILAAPPAEGAK